ncbi:MAG: phosphoadenosine phosphosulfate reductase family protein [Candidatus Helarchaeota archaeon]|nr:phosphoadenosine phosphosulfate reductase family protein [Candidatus Helarchaeota archaeon]
MPSKVFLGPNHNFWCNKCNIPILELKECPICGSITKQLQITPPYETTPAFERDLRLIRGVIDAQYGKGIGNQLIPPEKIVLLNKAPYFDRMDEIIVDGFVLGNLRFNPSILNWEFILKIEGARRLAELNSKNWLEVDDGAINHIAKGANVLAPGVVGYDQNFKKGDYLVVITSKKQAISTGPAKYSAAELDDIKRGMVVKTKDHAFPKAPLIRPAGQNWNEVINANKRVLVKRENQAKRFVYKTLKRYKALPLAVSFSGGKDSLCVLLIVLESIGKTDIFFIDTGIEYEETINFTKEIINDFELTNNFTLKKSRESFWDNLEKFGPPSKDYRWCCKVIKLANVTEFLNEQYPGKKVLTFIGIRQYESVSRYRDKKIWTNMFLPQQIGASPIYKWPSLLVWMYLLFKNVKINPLYYEGYKRVGCIYCPATKLSELRILKELHPELYSRWMGFLKNWAEKYNLSPEWAERGFWRWRKFKERGQINLANEIGIPEDKVIWQKEDKLEFHLVDGINPCQDGSFSIEGRINGYLKAENVANQLGILGKVKYGQDLGVTSLRTTEFSFNLFSDGTITIRGSKEKLEKNLQIILSLIKRANECIGCGICIPSCPETALSLKDQKIWVNTSGCNGCQACFEVCPILKYVP